jgi:YjbE family integral membrane protein
LYLTWRQSFADFRREEILLINGKGNREAFMLELLRAIGGILLIDIVLSGDNALVIGATAAGLQKKQRRMAILAGGTCAIVLRIVFALLASFLLLLPWLQAIGGVVLVVIAIRLLAGRQQAHVSKGTQQTHESAQENASQSRSGGFFSALLMIIVADVTMSLDNVLAIGALAHGNILALSLGILLSVSILLLGSTLVSELIKWLPWLLDMAALVLAWTGANMILHDQQIEKVLDDYTWTTIAVPGASLGIVLLADAFFRLQAKKLARPA